MMITHTNTCRWLFNISLFFWIIVNCTANYRKYNPVEDFILCFFHEVESIPLCLFIFLCLWFPPPASLENVFEAFDNNVG